MALFHLVLMRPEIPQNVGNVIRLSVNCSVELHLIHPFGFIWDEKRIKRASLDYWDRARIYLHKDFDAYLARAKPKSIYAFTTRGKQNHTEARYVAGAGLLFGNESSGLPWEELADVPMTKVKIPMASKGRSLNLANAVAVGAFEVWRQLGWEGVKGGG